MRVLVKSSYVELRGNFILSYINSNPDFLGDLVFETENCYIVYNLQFMKIAEIFVKQLLIF